MKGRDRQHPKPTCRRPEQGCNSARSRFRNFPLMHRSIVAAGHVSYDFASREAVLRVQAQHESFPTWNTVHSISRRDLQFAIVLPVVFSCSPSPFRRSTVPHDSPRVHQKLSFLRCDSNEHPPSDWQQLQHTVDATAPAAELIICPTAKRDEWKSLPWGRRKLLTKIWGHERG